MITLAQVLPPLPKATQKRLCWTLLITLVLPPPHPSLLTQNTVCYTPNFKLVNVNLRVVVKGGEYDNKELAAFMTSTDGRLSIRRRKYKTLEYLSPEWVTPKYPNPWPQNGLLVVIKGEHIGKYVRWIYHRFIGDSAVPIAILAVVNRVAGKMDTLLEVDRLEMDASHLSVCDESTEDRKVNDLLMQPLREKAREK